MNGRWIIGCLVLCLLGWALHPARCCGTLLVTAACQDTACADSGAQTSDNAPASQAAQDGCDHAHCSHSSGYIHFSAIHLTPSGSSYSLSGTNESSPGGAAVSIDRPPLRA